MWISEYVTGRSFNAENAALGEIRSSSNGNVSVSGTREYNGLPLIVPAGIAYIPAAGARTAVVPAEGGAVCLGVAAEPKDGLEAGELMLYSAGGASIVLKNDGRVLINGREVS